MSTCVDLRCPDVGHGHTSMPLASAARSDNRTDDDVLDLAVQSSSARALPAAFPDGFTSSGLLPRLMACWNGERIRGVWPVLLRQQPEHGGRRCVATGAG